MIKTALSWSSGKDSAWALHTLQQQGVDVATLVTTVNEQFERVAMHAVRQQLLRAQAEAVGIPLIEVPIPYPCSNEQYEVAMKGLIEQLQQQGVRRMAFGDLYLEDIRQYRIDRLQDTGIEPVFPLWHLPTDQLAKQMIDGRLKAVLTAVDPKQLASEFCGRYFDTSLLKELPQGVDPCGENGEFHSFVFDGPMFSKPVEVEIGEVVERDGFYFCDVLPRTMAECD